MDGFGSLADGVLPPSAEWGEKAGAGPALPVRYLRTLRLAVGVPRMDPGLAPG